MKRRIVIVGGGQAGAQVAISLRDLGVDDHIEIVSDENYLPYQRPPLSKAFLKGEMTADRLLLKPASYYDSKNIALAFPERVAAIDPRANRIETASGKSIAYDHLVLATGTRARWPKLDGAGLDGTYSLRTLADVDVLKKPLTQAERVIIIGGGFIGLEAAAVLRGFDRQVLLIEAEDRLLKRVTAAPVSAFFESLHRRKGVEFHLRTGVEAIKGSGSVSGVALAGGGYAAGDALLFAIGAVPNDEIAGTAGLACDNGILVDTQGRTSAGNIWACGDVARFESRRFGRRIRLESVQNAIDQAKAVAASIAGRPADYDPVPWFWSDQYDTRLQIAGLSSPAAAIEVAGSENENAFSVNYRMDGRLIAVDSINQARQHMLARRSIAEETAIPVQT